MIEDKVEPSEGTDSTTKKWSILTENHNVNLFKSADQKKWKTPWYFIQGADPQYGLIERYINKNPIPNWDEEIELTKQLVEKVNAMNPKPKFFVITGDLCDAVPTAEPDLFKAQEASFKAIFSKIDPSIPVLVTCGNHDVGNSPSSESLKIYNSTWGNDYYSFWCGGIFFITINSQFFMDSENVPDLAKNHEMWFDQQLEIAKTNPGSRVILLQHIPWFINSADEEEEEVPYFSLSKAIRDVWLEKIADAGIQKVFCGHLHRNAGGTYKNTEVIISSAIGGQLGSDESGIRVVKIYEDKIIHNYYALEDIPVTINI